MAAFCEDMPAQELRGRRPSSLRAARSISSIVQLGCGIVGGSRPTRAAMLKGLTRAMSDRPEPQQEKRRKLIVNLGSGPKGAAWLPSFFAEWRELRVDIDAGVAPDILADITDLS